MKVDPLRASKNNNNNKNTQTGKKTGTDDWRKKEKQQKSLLEFALEKVSVEYKLWFFVWIHIVLSEDQLTSAKKKDQPLWLLYVMDAAAAVYRWAPQKKRK